jgi:hypothetical protein
LAIKDYDMDTDIPIKDQAGYSPDESERKFVKKLETKFEEFKKARQHKVNRWRRNEELYNGEFLKPFKLPKYKSRVVANTVHSIIETIYAILTDRFPKVDIMPKKEEQVEPAKTAQEAVESEMEKAKCVRAINGMKRDGLIYGNGFVKVCYKDGIVDYSVPDIYSIFVDPLATNLKELKCLVFATPTYIDEIKRDYENGKYVKSEGRLDEYRSFIRKENIDGDGIPKGLEDNVHTDSPLDVNSRGASDASYGGGQTLLKEAWYYEGDELYVATWAGNVLLQKELSPYQEMPLVMFQNYQDEHHFWGKGEPEIVESLAVGTAILLSQSVDNIIYHGNPAMVMSKSMSKTPQNRPSDKPGQIYYIGGPHERVERLPAGNISSSTLPMLQSFQQMTDTVSGIHDITQGRNPSGVTASRAIAQLQEASQQVIRVKEREVGSDAVIDIYRKTLQMLRNNYEENITIRKYNEAGTGFDFSQIPPYLLDPNMDYKYVPGSSMPESRASRIDQALDFFQMGLLSPEQFWRWTQKDISKEILEEILAIKEQQMMAQQQDQQIMSESTDPDEVMNAKMRLREQQGFGEPMPEGEQQ